MRNALKYRLSEQIILLAEHSCLAKDSSSIRQASDAHFSWAGRVETASGALSSPCQGSYQTPLDEVQWLIQQRFKGTGMRWSEDGFNHLLHLRLAWVNHRLDTLFSKKNLTLCLYSPNE